MTVHLFWVRNSKIDAIQQGQPHHSLSLKYLLLPLRHPNIFNLVNTATPYKLQVLSQKASKNQTMQL